MKDRPNRVLLLGVVFFLVGGFIVYSFVKATTREEHYPCVDRGGIPVQAYDNDTGVVCIDPSALR